MKSNKKIHCQVQYFFEYFEHHQNLHVIRVFIISYRHQHCQLLVHECQFMQICLGSNSIFVQFKCQ